MSHPTESGRHRDEIATPATAYGRAPLDLLTERVGVIDEEVRWEALGEFEWVGHVEQRAFPDTRVVKALNTIVGDVMTTPKSVAEGDHSVFISGDDPAAKRVITELLTSFGWIDIIDLGGIQPPAPPR